MCWVLTSLAVSPSSFLVNGKIRKGLKVFKVSCRKKFLLPNLFQLRNLITNSHRIPKVADFVWVHILIYNFKTTAVRFYATDGSQLKLKKHKGKLRNNRRWVHARLALNCCKFHLVFGPIISTQEKQIACRNRGISSVKN